MNKYRIETPAVFSSNLTTVPISWEFQGSNDNSNWTTLDSKSDMTYSYNYETNIPNTNAYRYYRLFCTEYHDGGNPIDIGNLKLFSYSENFSPRLIIKNGGNIGIGNNNPTEKLHVDGNILATGTITPDYVFEQFYEGNSVLNPNYQFKALEKVEKFVKENHHLPGVPSAKDIKNQGGVIVNRATEINLEKIEELYLYIFEINKRIKFLENQLKECKDK